MNTPSHLIFGLTAFGRAGSPRLSAALAGSLVPDLSLYLMAGWHLNVLGTPPRVVFGELYFSDAWQNVFRIDNSFVLWGIALALAIMSGRQVWVVFCAAALLHLSLDFPVHNDDARAHFWPLTDWVFQSPLSYWDSAHHGRIVGVVEIAAALACCVVLFRRLRSTGMRLLIAGLGAIVFAPAILFGWMFAMGH